MTNEQAIDILNAVKFILENYTDEMEEAFGMAISALKAQQAAGDTISRQAAIDALDTAIEHYDEMAEECRKKADIERNDYMDMRDDAYEARQLAQWLSELKYLREKIEQPTIEPKRKKGKWQITDAYPHNVYCSECHKRFAQTHWAVWEDGSLPRNFCPNCGARMEEE